MSASARTRSVPGLNPLPAVRFDDSAVAAAVRAFSGPAFSQSRHAEGLEIAMYCRATHTRCVRCNGAGCEARACSLTARPFISTAAVYRPPACWRPVRRVRSKTLI